MYRLKNGWKAKDKNGVTKKSGELIELGKPDVARLIKLGMIEKVSVVVEKTKEDGDEDDSAEFGDGVPGADRDESADGEEDAKGRHKK